MRAGWGILMGGLLAANAFAVTPDVIAFGLRHTTISNAAFQSGSSSVLTIVNTSAPCDLNTNVPCNPSFGASIHLGSADAGVFVWPNCTRNDGWSLGGTSYGTVNGLTNQRIGSIVGFSPAWATYNVHVDFSALGVTSYTYQVFFHDLPTLRRTNAGPDSSTVYTGNAGGTPPRVNPFCRDGTNIGALVEFPGSITEFILDGQRTYATRLLIIAETPTKTVDDVARVDLLGAGGLPSFNIEAERLGKFGVFHEAIGRSRFLANSSELTVSNILIDDGFLAELKGLKKYAPQILPYALNDHPNLSCNFRVSGMSGRSISTEFLGEITLNGQADGGLNIATDSPRSARVFSNGVFAGTLTSWQGMLASVANTNCALVSYGAAGTQTNEPAHLLLRFLSPVTFTSSNAAPATGDELHIALTDTNVPVRELDSFVVDGLNVGEITITGVDTLAATPLPLNIDIERRANTVHLTWTAHPDYIVVSGTNVARPSQFFWNGDNYTNFTYSLDFPIGAYPMQYFRLRHSWESVLFP